MSLPCVLAVDDEPAILALISTALRNEGFHVLTAGSVREFWCRHAECVAEIYIVDIGLPDGNGFSLIKELRRTSNSGILVLSGRGSETDQVVGLEIGADDYVIKPFRLRELAARVNAIYRRCCEISVSSSVQQSHGHPQSTATSSGHLADFTFGEYRLSILTRRLWGPEMLEIDLTTSEFDLLVAFVRRRKQVLSRDQIMNAVKGREWESYDRAVDGLVCRLRKKIPPLQASSKYIRTVHGVGYSFIG